MPKVDDVGHSVYTVPKMEDFAKILDMHFMITQAVIKKHPTLRQSYRYVDMTAGKGHVPYSDIVPKVNKVRALEWSGISLVENDRLLGSPLVFLTIAESAKVQIPYHADFIEARKDNLNELVKAIKDRASLMNWNDINSKISLHNENYEQAIPELFPSFDDKELGLVFVDLSGKTPDTKILNYIFQKRPKMELLIYIAATNIKREFEYKKKNLIDFMRETGKDYWLIKKPIKGDKHQWTFLLGSSFPIFQNYKKIEFFQLDSSDAQNFFPKLNLSSKQRQDLIQPKLPNIDDD